MQGIRTMSSEQTATDDMRSWDANAIVSDVEKTTISHLTGTDRVVQKGELHGKAWTLSDLKVRP